METGRHRAYAKTALNMTEDAIDFTSCERCGGPATVHQAFDGARYILGVNDPEIFRILGDTIHDQFMLDRLRRAEGIIVQLRADLNRAHKELANRDKPAA